MAGTFNPSGYNPTSGSTGRKKKRKQTVNKFVEQYLANIWLGAAQSISNPLQPGGMNAGLSAGIGGPAQIQARANQANAGVTDFLRSQTARQAQTGSVGNTNPGITFNSSGDSSGHAYVAGTNPVTGGTGMLPTDSMSGFAGQYAPIGLDILYSDPNILARDSLKGMGINPNDGLMQLAEDQAGMMQYLAMLGMGTGNENSITPENYINFVNDYYKQQMTPGGASPDVWAMVDSILNSPEGSALSAYLTDGTPQDQAEALNTLVSVATSSLPPVFRKAIMGKLEDDTSDWLSSKAKGKESLISQYLKPGGLLG